ncbi:hypothetical protein ARMSODRAFT_660697 [Armillaria solidipes]|uniref:Uncharacterized protein n=1 Tax=Armillaria solidipes TaxID=1076256 RepID=A0A2H3AXP2_9AGAR|nr:hypothetical protein ARMSODRAFT_660697 [Armillaria solidipes]
MVSSKHVHWDDSVAADEPTKASVFRSKRSATIPSSSATTSLRGVPIPSTSFYRPSPVSSQQPILSELPAANPTKTAATSVRHIRTPSVPVSNHIPPTPSQEDLSYRTPLSFVNIPSFYRRRANSLPTSHQTHPSPPHVLIYPIAALPQPHIPPVTLHPFANHPHQPPPQKSTETSLAHVFLPFLRQSPPQQKFLPFSNHSPIPPSQQALTPSWQINPLNNPLPNAFKPTPPLSPKVSIHRSLRLGTCEPIDFFAPQRVRAHASVASEPVSQPPLPRLFILVDTGSDRFNIEVVEHQGLGFVTVDNVLARVQMVLRERLDPHALGGSFVEECECGGYKEKRCSFTTLCVGLTVREDEEPMKWKIHLKKVDASTR